MILPIPSNANNISSILAASTSPVGPPTRTFTEAFQPAAKKVLQLITHTVRTCINVAVTRALSSPKYPSGLTPTHFVSMPVQGSCNPALTIAHSLAQSAKAAAEPLLQETPATTSPALPLEMCPAPTPSEQDFCPIPAQDTCPARNVVEETVTAASSSYLPAVAGTALLITLAVSSATIYYFKYYKAAPPKKPTASEQTPSTWNRFLIRVGVRNAPKIEKFLFGLFQKPEWNIA